jgi:hypothetical protein
MFAVVCTGDGATHLGVMCCLFLAQEASVSHARITVLDKEVVTLKTRLSAVSSHDVESERELRHIRSQVRLCCLLK